ncbi:MAG: tetratricopeptide repeat protein [Thermoguttaceae bacterium]
MRPSSGLLRGLVLVAAGLVAPAALATDEGQEDLAQATRAKLNVRTLADLDQVVRLCEAALEKGLDPESTQLARKLLAATLIQRAKAYSKLAFDTLPPQRNWKDARRLALADLQRAAALDPDRPEAFFHIAQWNLLPEGDRQQAAQALEQAIGRARDEMKELKAEALVLRAELRKDPALKLADLNEALRLVPADAAALRARAEVLLGQDKLEAALADLDAALKLQPRHLPTHQAKASLLARMKKFDEAIAALELARKLWPDSPAPLVERATIRAMRGDYQAALADLDEAAAMDPANPAVMLLRASVYQQMNEAEKSRAELERLLHLRPSYGPAVRFRAVLLAGEGKFDEAIALVEQLLKEDPDDLDSRLQLALLLTGSKRHRKAIAVYTDILRQDPDNPAALRGRGDALLGIGQHAEAIADYEKALKLEPDDPGLLNNFAWVLATSPDHRLRDGKRALQMALKACRLSEYKQAHILSTLAAAYAELGDFDSALKWSEKALRLGKQEQKADLARELETYKARKPFRELKQEDQSEQSPPPQPANPGPNPAKSNARQKAKAKPAGAE